MLNVDFKIVMWNGGAIQNFNLVIYQLPLSIFVSLVPSPKCPFSDTNELS